MVETCEPIYYLGYSLMTWQEYQTKVADFFIAIGAKAQANVKVHGARGSHDVDVLVEITQFGIPIKWIIECKLWKSSIPKEKVLALQQITQDVGADRGILMSETGFQAGAIKCANQSNITLTSLDDLKDATRDALNLFELQPISDKLEKITNRAYVFMPPNKFNAEIDGELPLNLLGDMFLIRITIPKAINNSFPIFLKTECSNIGEFIQQSQEILTNADKELTIIEQKQIELNKSAESLVAEFCTHIFDLLKIGELVTSDSKAETKENKLIAAANKMKEIGSTSETLRKLVTREVFYELHAVMRCLIDGLYLHLTNPQLKVEVIYEDSKQLANLTGSLKQKFQESFV